ncbi:chlorohydrolase family protein [Pantoea sp. EA-12]|uniref:chlorohydrolase family protein n=1 Tax=Pantoea sp. EA-12 TaxID=3043303 RepID=UPI0024B57DB1|nr:chlorohydrolase family protein [Pantoea sp. EA-12]MDI9221063.1 chlorohydrolase family protein [Pantoea sp. EA-12]
MSDKVIRLRAAWVVGYQAGDHCLYANGEVVYQGDRILFVGHDYSGAVDEDNHLGNSVLAPGFIDLDALGDLDTTVLAFDNQPGWKTGRIVAQDWQRRDLYSREQLNFAKHYAYGQLLLNGITSFAPITSILYRAWAEEVDEYLYAADVVEELGARAWLGPAFMAGYYASDTLGQFHYINNRDRARQGLEDAVRFYERLNARGVPRLSGMLAPDRIEGGDDAWLHELGAVVKSLSCPTRLHCCQSELEVREIARRYQGRTSLEVLAQYGLLNAQMLLPHGQFLGGVAGDVSEDIARLADSGATLVACPLVSGRHGKYLEHYKSIRAAGINLALGTDTWPSDMFTNMQMGVVLTRVVTGDVQAASAADYYRMATLGGAKALGREDLGRLAPGCQADMIVISLDQPALGQIFDPITALVLNGNGRDVQTVIVAGKTVVRDRELVNSRYSVAELHQQSQQVFNHIISTYPERTVGHPPVSEIVKPAFNIVTREEP